MARAKADNALFLFERRTPGSCRPWCDKTHTEMHDIKMLLERGCKKQKLRAHSDLLPNRKVNDWALSFGENFDIQTEAKGKNLAAEQLYRQAVENSVI